jgi:hypothetical protein
MLDFLIQKAYAQSAVNNPNGANSSITFSKLFDNVKADILTPLIYLLFALAIVYFVWGVMVFIQNADNADKRKEGYDHMIWGIVGIFIMVSAIGIINIITATI